MPYSAIAAAAVAAHFAFLGYLIGGGFLAWRWPVTIWVHALIVGWTAIILTGVVECPLTTIERLIDEHFDLRPGAIQRDLDFEGTVYGATDDTSFADVMAQQAQWYGRHRGDQVADERTCTHCLPHTGVTLPIELP